MVHIVISSRSLVFVFFFSVMSNLLLVSYNIFFISDFIAFIYRSVILVSFHMSHFLTYSLIPLGHWSYEIHSKIVIRLVLIVLSINFISYLISELQLINFSSHYDLYMLSPFNDLYFFFLYQRLWILLVEWWIIYSPINIIKYYSGM